MPKLTETLQETVLHAVQCLIQGYCSATIS